MQSITELNAVKKKRTERQIVSEYFTIIGVWKEGAKGTDYKFSKID